MNKTDVKIVLNGRNCERRIEPRMLLSDFIRQEAGLTGTHVGCEHGVCGACTILLDGLAIRSCCALAVQADGRAIETVESLSKGGSLGPLQQAFWEKHGLQCGYCTPGMLMLITEFLRADPHPSREKIRARISDNLCRCTGYESIVDAVEFACRRQAEGAA